MQTRILSLHARTFSHSHNSVLTLLYASTSGEKICLSALANSARRGEKWAHLTEINVHYLYVLFHGSECRGYYFSLK